MEIDSESEVIPSAEVRHRTIPSFTDTDPSSETTAPIALDEARVGAREGPGAISVTQVMSSVSCPDKIIFNLSGQVMTFLICPDKL